MKKLGIYSKIADFFLDMESLFYYFNQAGNLPVVCLSMSTMQGREDVGREISFGVSV